MHHLKELPARCPKPTHELLQLLTRPWTMHVGVLVIPVLHASARCAVRSTGYPPGFSPRDSGTWKKRVLSTATEPTIPPAVTYGLTKRMEEISGALAMLDELAQKWQEEDTKAVRKPRPRVKA